MTNGGKFTHPKLAFYLLLALLMAEILSYAVVQAYESMPEQVSTISAWQIIVVAVTLMFTVIHYFKSKEHSADSHKRLAVTTFIVCFILAAGIAVDEFVVPEGPTVYLDDLSAEQIKQLPPEIVASIPTRAEAASVTTKVFDAWRAVFPSNIHLESNEEQ